MLSAHREYVRDFATSDIDVRMEIAEQISKDRQALGYTTVELAEAAMVEESSLALVEKGVSFIGSHEVVCAVLLAIARQATIRGGKSHLCIVQP